ncbi:hypothetical protein QQY24_01275 [Streptomyces sp. TG1A-8]|uniref:hypothetical protein n=1 Tax=Streptomyces sp. TG1A-8 TaxID=3051385 RepID=UPI00265BFDCE|nr:hypothetical protein [Streptomyces sp. TG1A-8]MDO0924120.1 hypothetical protein [Streptomyces sp. TG1A-8]
MTPAYEENSTSACQIQRLRDVSDPTDQLLAQLEGLERQMPLSAQLVRAKWGLESLPDDLDAYVDRLEEVAAESVFLRAEDIVPDVDLVQLTRDLLDFADWLDEVEEIVAATHTSRPWPTL